MDLHGALSSSRVVGLTRNAEQYASTRCREHRGQTAYHPRWWGRYAQQSRFLLL